jgi:alpha-glucosidase
VYEDEGNTLGYQEGRSATIHVKMKQTTLGDPTVQISPATGSYPGIRRARAYEIRFANCTNPESVFCNNESIARTNQKSGKGWMYDGESMTLIVRTRSIEGNRPVEVRITERKLTGEILEIADGFRNKIARLRRVAGLINANAWPNDWSPDVLVHAEQTGNRISFHPENLKTELLGLKSDLHALPAALDSLRVQESVLLQARAHLRGILTP